MSGPDVPRAADAPLPDTSSDRVILVPLDGTPSSEAVLATIGEIARTEGASVRLVRVHAPTHEVEVDGRIVAYADQETERVEAETPISSSTTGNIGRLANGGWYVGPGYNGPWIVVRASPNPARTNAVLPCPAWTLALVGSPPTSTLA